MAPPEGDAAVLPLPELPASQHGCSSAQAKHYHASVSNASGYMCHIHLDVEFPVPPAVLFELFTHPDNSVAFRDIKRVGYRKVLQNRPGFKLVEVEQVGAMRILWAVERQFTTLLRVEEDSRDPDCLKTTFDLVRSDVLAKFHGSWRLTPVVDPATGEVTGCKGELEQDVLPRGVPPFFAHLPLLGGLLRGASLNTIKRLVEDMTALVDQIKATGKTVGEVIDAVAAKRGHAHAHTGEDWGGNGAVESFRISDEAGGSDGEEEGREGGCGEEKGGKEGSVGAAGGGGKEDGREGGAQAEGGGGEAAAAVPVAAAEAAEADPAGGVAAAGGAAEAGGEAAAGCGAAPSAEK